MSSLRLKKVNELIKKLVGELLLKEVSFKRGILVTVAKVDTTPDLRYTRVFMSVFPPDERLYVIETLKREMYSLQGALNHKLHMKPLPRLLFELDTTEERAQEVEDILKTLG